MHRHRLERVLVINGDWELRGLMTVKDILKSSEHPNACKDQLGRLRVGAAVGVGEGTEERVEALVEAGVDVIVVDTAHGHAQGVLDRVKWVKKNFPQVQVIGGNIATRDGAQGARRPRRRRREGRHRPGFDLHHAHRRRRRRAADHGDPERRRGARGHRTCPASPTAASATRATSPRRIAAGAAA